MLVGKPDKHLLLHGGALLLAVGIGAAIAYAQRFMGDAGPYFLVGVLLVAIVAAAILFDWRLGALMLAAALPFGAVITFGTLASGIKALALLTFFSLALALLREQKLFARFLRLWQQPLTLAVAIFVLWVLTSTLWASSQEAALLKTSRFVGVFGLMIVVGMLEKRHVMLLWAIMALSAALSVPAGYILPVPEGSDMAVSGRFGTGGADPNTYACFLVIVFFVAYFGFRQYRSAIYILAPVLFYGIFATLSRTGLVALVATPLLAIFVPRMAARLGLRTLLMYSVGAAAFAAIILAVPELGDIVAERYVTLSDYESEETWSGRWSIWQAAFQVIASHPVLGIGAGNFAYFAMEHSTTVAAHSAAKGEVAGVAHNMFLSVASELGIIGLVLFAGALFLAFKTLYALSLRFALGTGIFLGLIAFTIAGMTLTWEHEKVGYMLFGTVLALQLHDSARRAPALDKREGHY